MEFNVGDEVVVVKMLATPEPPRTWLAEVSKVEGEVATIVKSKPLLENTEKYGGSRYWLKFKEGINVSKIPYFYETELALAEPSFSWEI